MIFLSLIMDLLLALGIGIGGTEVDVQAQQHHFGPDNPGHGHTIHGHSTVLHHGVHGHTTGPSGHEPLNPHTL